jgi:predicted Zn-dependent protease
MDRKAQIETLLNDNPNDIFLQYALAMELMSENNHFKAIEVLSTLKAQEPEYLPVYYQLAKLYETVGENDKAIATYEAGIIIAQKSNDRKTLGELKSALEELIF